MQINAESGGLAMNMKRFVSVKPMLCILLVFCVMCSLLTLTACGKEIDAESISIVAETVPDVVTVGNFELSQIKLKVLTADGNEQEIAVTHSMLDTASKNNLKQPGEKTINVYYNKRATTFTIFLVEEGTEIVSVTFLAKDFTKIAKKYAIKGNGIEAPIAPSVSGMIFDCWRNKDNSQPAELDAVNSDMMVYASYTENANKYTVTFYGINNQIVKTLTDVPHNTLITAPELELTDDIASYQWNWDFRNERITQNTSIYITVFYKTKKIFFKYVYSEAEGEFEYPLTSTATVKTGSAPSDEHKASVISELNSKNKTFIKWLYEDKVKAGTSDTMIAVVEPCYFNIIYPEYPESNTAIRSGLQHTIPSTATKSKTGYDFAGKWKDQKGNIYNAGQTIIVNDDLTLSAVYNPKIQNANYKFNFLGLFELDGETTLSYDFNNQVEYDKIINRAYLNDILNNLKIAHPSISKFDIDMIYYDDGEKLNTVNSAGFKIGNNGNYNFIIDCVDLSMGSPGLEYTINGEGTGYIVTGYTPSDINAELNIVIPSAYTKDEIALPVVGIGNGVFSSDTYGSSLIFTITFPECLEYIREEAFKGATFLGDIVIPASVKQIEQRAFINAKSEIEGGITLLCNGGNELFTTIADSVFANFTGLKKVVLPATVKTIDSRAFYGCGTLQEINLNDITEIGNEAFAECIKLNLIGNLNKVLTVGEKIFQNTEITNLALPSVINVNALSFIYMDKLSTLSLATDLSDDTLAFDFSNLIFNKVKTITLGDRVISICNNMVNYTEILGTSLEEIYGASLLESINISSAMETMDISAFVFFPLIKSINIDVNNPNYYVTNKIIFSNNTLLYYMPTLFGDYIMPSSINGKEITAIGDYAFANATINKLTLQNGVEYIFGTKCFGNIRVVEMSMEIAQSICNGQMFTMPANDAISTLDAVFNNKIIYYITGYDGLDSEGQEAFDTLLSLSNGRIIKNNSQIGSIYDSESGLLYTVNNGIVTITGGNPKSTEIIIPAKINSYIVGHIGDNAFDSFIYLETLNIQATLTNLNCIDAFKNCVSLQTVTLAGLINKNQVNRNLFIDTLWYKNNVVLVIAGVPVAYNSNYYKEIDGEQVLVTEVTANNLTGATLIPKEFFKNTQLSAITLPQTITRIEEKAFENCVNLKTINLNNVKELGKYAFKDCIGLLSVSIPEAINGNDYDGKLPVGAFYGCIALKSVDMPNVNGFFQDGNQVSEAFYNCVNLKDVSFLNHFTGTIFSNTFYGCSAIEMLDLSLSNIEKISDNAFSNCNNLAYLVLGSKINSIGANAFSQTSTALESIRIKGAGGIFNKGLQIAIGVFPSSSVIYIDANVQNANDVLSNYTFHIVEPRITFEMMPNFKAGSNVLDMNAVSTSYLHKAPSAPVFDGYLFVGWYIGANEVEFPYTFTEDTILYAKYYSASKGSISLSDLQALDTIKGYYKLNAYSSTDKVCYIPAKFVDGSKIYTITVINLDIFAGTNITKLVIPEGVKILNGSLYGSSIDYLSIPSSVQEITDADAFTNMTNLEIVWADGSNLVSAYASAFVNTKWYDYEMAKADKGYNGRFVIAGRLAIYYYPSIEEKENYSIQIPNTVIKLNNSLFAGNLLIKSITFNDNLQIIGDNCFSGASNLENIYYETEVGNSAINDASLSAFAGTKWLNAKNHVYVGSIYLKYNGIDVEDSIILPIHIKKIAPNAFVNAAIKEISFGNKLIEIGDDAFKGSKLISIILPSTVKVMGLNVFANCADLTFADLPLTDLTILPAGIFDSCTSLKTVKLSSKISRVSVNSFNGCSALATIIANGLCDSTEFLESGITGTAWYKQEAVTQDLHLILGKIYVKYKIGSNPVLNEDNLVEITIPDQIMVILQNAFKGNSQIGKVIVPSTVISIEANAFFNCTNLSAIFFNGASLKTIGDSAFSGANKLSNTLLPDSLEKIGGHAFDSVAFISLTIPDSVTTIGEYAFANISTLQTLTLGRGLSYIGRYAFSECNKLSKVTWNLENTVVEDVNTIIQLYNIDEGSKEDENYSADKVAYIDTIFYRTGNTVKIRMYVPSSTYTVLGSIAAPDYVSMWNSTNYFNTFIIGDLPTVNFDCDGYIMESFTAEEIIHLNTPSKTNHTFIRWEINGKEVNLPYLVNQSVTITAIWYNNIRSYGMSDEVLSYSANLLADGITGVSYNITDIAADNETLYVPNRYNNLPVVNFEFTTPESKAHAAYVKHIVFTQISNFASITTNIFKVFTNLETVRLLDSNANNIKFNINEGAMYSADNKVLIAYFIQKDAEDKTITSFKVPDKVTTILPFAFVNSGLEKIEIPASMITIGEYAFNNAMNDIIFKDGIFLQNASRKSFENTIWYNTKSYQNYLVDGSAVGKYYAAANMLLTYHEISEINSLILPNAVNGVNITVIASEIYTYPATPRETAYTKIKLPRFLIKINSDALKDMDTLDFDGSECITTLVSIADNVFDQTTYYNTSSSGEDLLMLGKVLLRYRNTAETLDLSNKSILAIASNAFSASQLYTIKLPAGLTTISDRAFFGSVNLQEIEIPASVTIIGESAFENCTSLKTIGFAENSILAGIGASAFAKCWNLKKIAVPYTVTTIGDNAFNNCQMLETVTFDKIQIINPETGAPKTEILKKSLLTNLGESAFEYCTSLLGINIPNGLTQIKQNTFNNCKKLVTVNFESDKSLVKTIGKQAFYKCESLGSIIDIEKPNLVTVILPNALINVEEQAFAYCSKMYGIQFNYNIDKIGDKVFLGCQMLAKIVVYADTPPQIATNESLVRETGVPKEKPYYNLRIYVKNITKVYNDYTTIWSVYENNLFKIGDYPKLTYRYHSEGTVPYTEDHVLEAYQRKDIYINPTFTFTNKVTVTNWKFARVNDDTVDSRVTTVLGGESYQTQYNNLTATNDIILVMDYDIVIQNVAE